MSGDLTTRKRHVVDGHLQYVGGVKFETLVGDKTIDESYGNILVLDPGGASRNVTLRDGDGNSGDLFEIVNSADDAENLVIKNTAGTTVVTIGQNYTAKVVNDGGIGWTLIGKFSNLDTNT